MSKIFCIGLSRTGTTSFHTLMESMGYKSIHYPNEVELWADRHDVYSDIPVSLHFKALDRLYPNSKFIYTWRENWVDCVEEYFKRKSNRPNQSLRQIEIRRKMYGDAYWNRETYAEAYKNHEQDVFEYFHDRPDDLLCVNIVGGDSPKKLADFIGYEKRVPYKYPHENKL